mgnify:CR=1 FL=1
MPTIKPNKSEEIIGKIFGNSETVYGLKEFEGINVYEELYIFEDSPHQPSPVHGVGDGSLGCFFSYLAHG